MYLTVLVANLFSGSENLSSADNQQETFIIEGILNDYTPDLGHLTMDQPGKI